MISAHGCAEPAPAVHASDGLQRPGPDRGVRARRQAHAPRADDGVRRRRPRAVACAAARLDRRRPGGLGRRGAPGQQAGGVAGGPGRRRRQRPRGGHRRRRAPCRDRRRRTHDCRDRHPARALLPGDARAAAGGDLPPPRARLAVLRGLGRPPQQLRGPQPDDGDALACLGNCRSGRLQRQPLAGVRDSAPRQTAVHPAERRGDAGPFVARTILEDRREDPG